MNSDEKEDHVHQIATKTCERMHIKVIVIISVMTAKGPWCIKYTEKYEAAVRVRGVGIYEVVVIKWLNFR